ncbi:MAG TPA: efflux RND transporter periplasmic adaptor subunit [Thermoanaerobaculia bacterium]|nr:efflux RND transporter periplasmic adaptor subunit [Thermoanaerobaculia bacterium]
MKRSVMFVIAAAFVAAGCAKEKPAPVVSKELPADVQSVVGEQSATTVTSESTVTTEATAPAVAPLETKLSATGEFISPMQSELAVKIPGRVATINADEGERVNRGAVLLTIESDYASLELQRARAELARADAGLSEARRDLGRKSELKAKGSVPQAMYDRSRAQYEQAEAGRSAAASVASLARERVGDSALRAPFTGVVVERRTAVGERLGDATVAFVLAQTSPLKLRFSVPERYLATVARGRAVRASVDPYPSESFTGTVNIVAQTIDPKTRSFFVEALFPNSDGRLRPGLFARVEMDLR